MQRARRCRRRIEHPRSLLATVAMALLVPFVPGPAAVAQSQIVPVQKRVDVDWPSVARDARALSPDLTAPPQAVNSEAEQALAPTPTRTRRRYSRLRASTHSWRRHIQACQRYPSRCWLRSTRADIWVNSRAAPRPGAHWPPEACSTRPGSGSGRVSGSRTVRPRSSSAKPHERVAYTALRGVPRISLEALGGRCRNGCIRRHL